MQICGRAGKGPGRMAHGTEKKVDCLKVLMAGQHGKNSQKDYQLLSKVWEGLVFVLLHQTATGCMQQLMPENMAAFTVVMMPVKHGLT